MKNNLKQDKKYSQHPQLEHWLTFLCYTKDISAMFTQYPNTEETPQRELYSLLKRYQQKRRVAGSEGIMRLDEHRRIHIVIVDEQP